MEENLPTAQVAPQADQGQAAPTPVAAEQPPLQTTPPATQPPAPVVPEATPPEKKSNPVLWISLTILLLALLGAGGYFLLNSRKVSNSGAEITPSVSVSPSPTSDPTANWKEYSNAEGQFSFKYPPSYGNIGLISGPFTGTSKFIQSFSDPTTIREGTDASFDGLSVYLVSDMKSASISGYLSAETTAMSKSQLVGTKELAAVPFTTNGNAGFAIEFNPTLKYYYLPSADGKSAVVISRTYSSQAFLSIFDQILSTFKYGEATPSATPTSSPSATLTP